MIRNLTTLTLLLAVAFLNAAEVTPSPLHLRYSRPATTWTEALPVGNGRIGAMIFGGTEDEHLQINEATLWGGAPHDYVNSDASTHLDEIRQLIFVGKVEEAEKLATGMMGNPKLLMPYQPFCDLRLHFAGHDQASQYERELDLEHAIATTRYQVGTTTFRREVFTSYPDQVLVVRLTASQPGQLTFNIRVDSPQPGTQVAAAGEALTLGGQIQPRQNSPRSWTGSWSEPGMKFAAIVKLRAEGGSVRAAQDHLEVSSADSVTILFSNATSFKNYRDISGDALASAEGYVQRASQHSFEQLRQGHAGDFSRLFSRVRLNLGDDQLTDSTDNRIKAFSTTDDPALLALYFEFGRYLLISSSRPGGQPAICRASGIRRWFRLGAASGLQILTSR